VLSIGTDIGDLELLWTV